MRLEAAVESVGGDYGPDPGMLANIVFRFTLNLTAAVACWVPMRLFHRNDELAGIAMAIAMALLNFYYALNSVIWNNNDIGSWPKGYGWCDIQLVSWIPLETLNAAAICAVMQNISKQVSLARASELTNEENRRKQINQALIIFPIPALQVTLYYFVITMRYNISGIIGCQAVFEANWVFLVFFILPCPIFAVAAAYFAVLTWWRYRKINATFRRALYSPGQHGVRARGARTKRKLYFMALTIVAPYCPMQLVFLFNNVKLGWPWGMPYSLADLHVPGWSSIDYAPSTAVTFVSMYINYIAALEVAVFFLYFGRSEQAHEMYRRYLRALGLGRLFPALTETYHPHDRSASSVRSLWPRAKSISCTFTSIHSRSSLTHKARAHFTQQPPNDIDDTQLFDIHLDDLDLETARSVTDAARPYPRETPQAFPNRSPWVFRRVLALPFELPKMPVPAFFSSRSGDAGGLQSHSQNRGSRETFMHQLYHFPSRSPMRHDPHHRSVPLESWSPNQDPIVSPHTWGSYAFGPALMDDAAFRLSAYDKGLVSVRRDFQARLTDLVLTLELSKDGMFSMAVAGQSVGLVTKT